MSDNRIVLPKRTRASTSKVRTGCVTCKIRHVKCDEEKPACRRCLNSGRRCGGYVPSPSIVSPLNSIVIYQAPTQNPMRFVYDFSQIDYYQSKVAARLSGYWDSNFWSMLVMQLSHSEPAIQHALNAIARAVRSNEELNAEIPGHTYQLKDPLALRECNAAMRCLSKRIEQDPSCRLIPLVACLLFTCLEFINGTVDSAMVHIQSGFKIIKSVPKSSTGDQAYNSDSAAVKKHILPIFERLNSLCALFGSIRPSEVVSVALELNDHQFTTLPDARQRFYQLINPTIKFIRISAEKAHMALLQPDDYAQQLLLLQRLQTWTDELQNLIDRLRHLQQLTEADEIAAAILFMQQKTIFIWLSTCLQREECAVDSYTTTFEEIVDIGAKVTARSGSSMMEPNLGDFSFEMKLIAPLYYTALKCRVPALRRRAVELLRFAPHREGLFDANIAINVVERIIQIEERNLTLQQSASSSLENALPQENDRIFFINEMPGKFKDTNDSMTDYIESVFITKPWGINGK